MGVELLEVHEARRHGAAGERGRRQADRLRLVHAGLAGVREPGVELLERVRVELVPVEGAFGVLICLRGGGLGSGGGNFLRKEGRLELVVYYILLLW